MKEGPTAKQQETFSSLAARVCFSKGREKERVRPYSFSQTHIAVYESQKKPSNL